MTILLIYYVGIDNPAGVVLRNPDRTVEHQVAVWMQQHDRTHGHCYGVEVDVEEQPW
jgi:hypothetical protein